MEEGNGKTTDVDTELSILQCLLLRDITDREEKVRHKTGVM
jgi:hypothetical protein